MFRVEWLQSALDELTTIWTGADSTLRQAITSATYEIDRQLRSDPFSHSESRSEGRRVLFASPLGITFRVEADRQRVSVLRVWAFRRRTPQ